jgi:hypothetical protein
MTTRHTLPVPLIVKSRLTGFGAVFIGCSLFTRSFVVIVVVFIAENELTLLLLTATGNRVRENIQTN